MTSAAVCRSSANVLDAGAVVLVNSSSPRFSDFQQRIQPYLSNFGVPYVVLDIASNAVTTNLNHYALIIVGHAQLDTNNVYLDAAAQSNVSQAVFNGTGLVNFDGALTLVSNTPAYQYVQDIFAFGYGVGTNGTNVTFPATEPGGSMHYVTARHTPTNAVILSNSMSLANLVVGTNSAIALSGGKPLLVVKSYGQGRAVQWASYDWMKVSIKGPVAGLDDLLWRGFVWATRKPFVMRGLPNFATLRVDDVQSSFTWAQQAAAAGFRPWLGVFLDYMTNSTSAGKTPALRALVTNGLATTSIHSIDSTQLFYWNHNAKTNLSDTAISNNFAMGTAWHTNNGIPISKVVCPHYAEIGSNAFGGLLSWGVEYVATACAPNTLQYYAPFALWLTNGPYRLYEPPLQAQSKLPYMYADYLDIPNHPEMSGKFFNATTIIRDDSDCGEWCPDNDVPGSVGRGVRQLKRAFDSLAMGTLFTHDNLYISLISSSNWVAILSGVTNGIASYNPQYVTLDYACQYVRATRTATLTGSTYDTATGRLKANFIGKTDLATVVHIYNGEGTNITATTGAVPVFTNGTNITVAMLLPPSLNVAASPPGNVTISWPNPATGFVLQQSSDLGGTNWVTVTNLPTAVGEEWQLTLPASETNSFYRLKKP